MKQHIAERVLSCAKYMLGTGSTVRGCAAIFDISKTTVHKDMRVRLPLLDEDLARKVDHVLGINRQERHIRGGAATRAKYKKMEARETRAP
ncbi:MAG: sporulation transcriptional regulator SpoIIID [Clostridia bacterium]